MKKAERVLAFMLMIVLLITPQHPVCAETNSSAGGSLSTIIISDQEGNLVDYMMANICHSQKDVNQEYITKYYINVPEGYEEDVILPVKLKRKGILVYSLAKNGESDSIDYDLYSDPECSDYIYTNDNQAYIKKSGTYYIRISSTDLDEDSSTSIVAALTMFDGENVVLKNKKETYSCIADDSKPVYFKYVVPKTCRVAVSIGEVGDLYTKITLCNAKKQKITDTSSTSITNGLTYYALKKGTYYFRVEGYKGIFAIKAANTYFDSKGGTSRSKATSLKINGAGKTTAILAESKTSKQTWYKFYNPKNQKMSLYFDEYFSSGTVKISCYDQKGKKFGSDYTLYGAAGQTEPVRVYVKNYLTGAEYLPKGTYYLKIVKDSKKSCGTLKVSVKNKYK